MSKGNVLLGAVAGIAAGAIVGILMAPEKGSKTLKKITDRGNDQLSELKSVLKDFSDSIAAKFESTKRESKNLTENGRADFENLKKEVKNVS